MKLLSSLNLPSVSKHCLGSDLTTWLVYPFLVSSTGLQSFSCSVCSQQLFCISVFFQFTNSCLGLDTISVQVFLCRIVLNLDLFIDLTFSSIYSWVTQPKG